MVRRSQSGFDNDQAEPPGEIGAAQYVRMSTDHQQYSTENHADAIRQYAAVRGFRIVRTYADEGRSGLSLDGRDAFKQLIEDVRDGLADFEAILVYDVGRWGRFQDADEAAITSMFANGLASASTSVPSSLGTTAARWPGS